MNMQLATGKSTMVLFLEGNIFFIPLETRTLNLAHLHPNPSPLELGLKGIEAMVTYFCIFQEDW